MRAGQYQPGGCGGSNGGSGSGNGGSGNNGGGVTTTAAPVVNSPSNTFPVTVVSGSTVTFHYECERCSSTTG